MRMELLVELTQQVREGAHLDASQAEQAAHALASADENPLEKEAFLDALHEKGETVAEITAFAGVFRTLALDPGLDQWRSRALDIVGTGGSGVGGYNISSVTALITAAAGVPVLKHGNLSLIHI